MMEYEYIYVRVEVGKADPRRAALLAGLLEKISDRPVPDVIPHTDPGAIAFKHCRIMATSDENAYDIGYKMLPPVKAGCVMNDYVLRI